MQTCITLNAGFPFVYDGSGVVVGGRHKYKQSIRYEAL